jgi:hypothetical protein
MVTTRSNSSVSPTLRKRGASAPLKKTIKKAARVSIETTTARVVCVHHSVPLNTIRNSHIVGSRLARHWSHQRGWGADVYCLGTVIAILARGDEDLDGDLYRVSYDDGGWEDLDTLTLFGV